MKIVQLYTALSTGDAISDYIVEINELLKKNGYTTDIYLLHPELNQTNISVYSYNEIKKLNNEDIILYHHCTETELNYQVCQYTCKKIMIFHNITPPHFFQNFSERDAISCQNGYEQTLFMRDKFDYCITVSTFNKEILHSLGYDIPIKVSPIVKKYENDAVPDNNIIDLYSDKYINILFVGRLVPNKKIEDLLKIFCDYKKRNKKSRLLLVGNDIRMPSYVDVLKRYILDNQLEDVIFTGKCSANALAAYYTVADVFLCLSEHEGFCVPLVEAMSFDIPVIAYDAAAIHGTLAESGVLIQNKEPSVVCDTIETLITDPQYKNKVIESQRKRLRELSYKDTSKHFLQVLSEAVNYMGTAAKRLKKRTHIPKVLFDGKLLCNELTNDHNRSGIYVVAKNSLEQLYISKKYSIVIYIEEDKVVDVRHALSILGYPEIEIRTRDQNDSAVIRYGDIDIFFSPADPPVPEIEKLKHIKKWVILYDVASMVLESSETHVSPFVSNLLQNISANDFYICISEFTKKEFLRLAPKIDPEKMTVIPLAASDLFYVCNDLQRIQQIRTKYGVKADQKYVLSVCTLGPRKNLLAAVRCFIRFLEETGANDIVFLLVGGNMDNFRELLTTNITHYGKYKDKILLAGYAEDEDLAPLYSGALFGIYLSVYEGFGLPILEAMKCGCPIVASNVTSMPEVTGSAGLSVDPRSDKEITEAYKLYYSNAALRNQKKSMGIKRSESFSWNIYGKHLCETIEKSLYYNGKTISIVFITDNNYVITTCVAIQSIIETKSIYDTIHVYIIVCEVDDGMLNRLASLETKTVRIYIIQKENPGKEFNTQDLHVTSTALLKFDIPNILSQCDKVLYLDGDILVRGNLAPLYSISLKNYYAAVVSDIIAVLVEHNEKSLGIQNYFNSGVMLLNLKKMREENLSTRLFELKKKKRSSFMDQDIFNEMFSENVLYIDGKYNLMMSNIRDLELSLEKINDYYNWTYRSYEQIEQSAVIHHLTNKKKPWKYINTYMAKEWREYWQNSPCSDLPLDLIDNTSNQTPLNHGKIILEKGPLKKICQGSTTKIYLFDTLIGTRKIGEDGMAEISVEDILWDTSCAKRRIILSMTSYPTRIKTLAQVFEPLFRQTMRPDRYILWLAPEQFPQRERELPDELLALQRKGLEIFWRSNLKAHTKYYYAMREFPDDIIVTVDDDIQYGEDVVEKLYASYKRFPQAVSCFRSHRILFDADGNVMPYRNWGWESKEYVDSPRMDLCATGVMGVLYPPHCLPQEAFNVADIKQLALFNDDLWLKVMETAANVPVVQIANEAKLAFIANTQEETLNAINVLQNENDIIFRNIIEKYNNHFGGLPLLVRIRQEDEALDAAMCPSWEYDISTEKRIDFTRRDLPDFIQKCEGLSHIETWGRRSDAKMHDSVRVVFRQQLPDRFTLDVEAQPFGPNTNEGIIVNIGSTSRSIHFPKGRSTIHLSVSLDGECANVIEFIPPHPTRPRDIGMNNDARLLGIGFVSLTITSRAQR